MTPPSLITVLTGIALLATLIARFSLAHAALRSPVARRIRTVCGLVAALLALRMLAPAIATPLLTVLVLLTAAWLPFAGLRMAEELCRRHAPRPAKLAALGGALGFTVLAFTVGAVWSRQAMIALALWQSAMLAVMVWHLVRGRRSLAPAERGTVDTFLVALLATIPLAATDFEALIPMTTLRGGPFAILILMLAVSRLATGAGTPRQLFADIAVSAGAGLLAALCAAAVFGEATFAAVADFAAGGLAIAALALLAERLSTAHARQTGIVAALAAAPEGDRDALIAAHPLLSTGRLLGAAELAGYPSASVARLLEHRVVGADAGDSDIRAAAGDLLDATASTHLLRLSREPPRFLAITASGLSGPALDDELSVAARLIERAS